MTEQEEKIRSVVDTVASKITRAAVDVVEKVTEDLGTGIADVVIASAALTIANAAITAVKDANLTETAALDTLRTIKILSKK